MSCFLCLLKLHTLISDILPMLFLLFQASRLSGLLFLHHATLKVRHAGLCLFLYGIYRISGLCRHILDIFFDSVCLVFHFIFVSKTAPTFEPARCPILEVVLTRFSLEAVFFFQPSCQQRHFQPPHQPHRPKYRQHLPPLQYGVPYA